MGNLDDKQQAITQDMMIPELLRAAPELRPVLDRYGLHGCGGEFGPMESLEFFARAHDVPLHDLLAELNDALQKGTESEGVQAPSDSIADSIYQPFFKAGIAVVLTLGAAWGAYLLLRIGILKSFTAVGLNEVNAHGHAQIFGWVGLFVMGFAYQAFPRFKHTSLAHPRLALATLWLMLSGIVLRSGSQAFLETNAYLIPVGIFGSILEIAAIGTFVWVIWRTLRGSGKSLAFYDYYILSALGWFVAQAAYEAAYFVATSYAPSRDALLTIVSTWQAPLRDLQIHGFAMLMILGVSQRIFHNFYGLPAPNPRRSLVVLALLNMTVIGEAVGFVLMRRIGHAWVGLWYGSVIVMAVSLAYLVLGWRLHTRSEESDRSLKFLRMAYVWLFISMAMMVCLPVYQFGLLKLWAPQSHAAEIGFSHAYYGAIRHAITVGFISLMIVGVAAKVVPTLKGIDVRSLTGLWMPFILLNLGCALRVSFQTLTDFHEMAFPAAGISGLLEVTALAIWGTHLWRIMNGRVSERSEASTRLPLLPGAAIVGENRVGDVLEAYPHVLPVFLEHGFTPLANPVLRKTLAKHVTINSAARKLDVNPEHLLKALNSARSGAGAALVSDSVLSEVHSA
ncbi:MAG: DUF1858 domain-containing protein [Candidatus Hydrogenedentes bacterium]|nr:DUF1858 domain-containing protein [Candidatus Hydrogenedentota bacterium]